MKTKSLIHFPFIIGVLSSGAVLFMAGKTQAQNLLVSDYFVGNIYEYTPGGAQSPFASGAGLPYALAFDRAGNLFEADDAGGNIYEYTPGGAQSTFASGLNYPFEIAFQPVPEPPALALLAVSVSVMALRLR